MLKLKHNSILLMGAIALLVAIILPIVAVYIATTSPESEEIILYLGLTAFTFAIFSILLLRKASEIFTAEQLKKLVKNSNT